MSDPPIDSRPSTPATEQRTRELVGTIDRIAARQRKAERERGRNFWVEVSRIQLRIKAYGIFPNVYAANVTSH
jgi:hypothetical protein